MKYKDKKIEKIFVQILSYYKIKNLIKRLIYCEQIEPAKKINQFSFEYFLKLKIHSKRKIEYKIKINIAKSVAKFVIYLFVNC